MEKKHILFLFLFVLFNSCNQSYSSSQIKALAINNCIDYLKRSQVFLDLNQGKYSDNNSCFIVDHQFIEFSLSSFSDDEQKQIKQRKEEELDGVYSQANLDAITYFDEKYFNCERSNVIFSFSKFHQNSLLGILSFSDMPISPKELDQYREIPYKTEFSYLFIFDKSGNILNVYDSFIGY